MSMNSDEAPRTKGDGGLSETTEIKSALDSMTDRLGEAEAARSQHTEQIKKLTGTIDSIKKSVDDLPGDYGPQVKALEKEVAKLVTGAALAQGKSANASVGLKAITQAVADSDGYKSMVSGTNRPMSGSAAGTWFGKSEIPSFGVTGYKASIPVQISDLSGINLDAYRPGVFEDQKWAMSLALRFPRAVVKNATNYYIPKETDASRYGAWTSTLAAALDGDPTPKSTIEFAEVDGLVVGSTVRFYNTSGVLLGTSVVVSINTSTKVVTFTTDSLTWDAAIGDRVVSENYGATAETAVKPYGWVGTENVNFALKLLATIVPTTVNAMNTIPGLQSMIERKLPERHLRNLSWHLLYGDASVANQLQGLRTYTGAQTYSWSSGTSGDNQVDAVMRAANLIPWTSGLGVIMSQQDLPSLFLLKGSDGHYLRTGNFGMVPLSQIGQAWYLGPYELVFDYAVTSTHFTVINWSDASELVDQDTASLLWGYINDDFEKNIIRARYEATMAHAIKSTQAYVAGTWDAAP
jgi:hypothetical protein